MTPSFPRNGASGLAGAAQPYTLFCEEPYNHRRLHGELDHVPPAEYEEVFWATQKPNHYPHTPVLTEAGTT